MKCNRVSPSQWGKSCPACESMCDLRKKQLQIHRRHKGTIKAARENSFLYLGQVALLLSGLNHLMYIDMKEGEIAPHEANDRRFIARIPKKAQQNYILIKNLYVKEYYSAGYYRGCVNYFTKIRVRVLNKWFEQDDRVLKLLSIKIKKVTISKAVKAFAAQQKAGKENGVKAYAYKEPFMAEYRQERNRNGTRKDDVTKLLENYPKAKKTTLMEYAKEADHEDEFPRPRGRKSKKE